MITRTRWFVSTALASTAAAFASLLLPTSPSQRADVAWIDTRATQDATAAITQLVSELFTVSPDSITTVRAAAQRDLSGAAVAEFQSLYGPVLERARASNVTVRTELRGLGMEHLTATSAEVLVVADQTATAGGQSQTGPALLRVTASRDAGRWTISDLQVL